MSSVSPACHRNKDSFLLLLALLLLIHGSTSSNRNAITTIGTNIGNAISGAVKSGINGVISAIERTINKGVDLINGAINLINKIPGVSIGKVSRLSLPRLAQGGVLAKGQIGLLEGSGAEAVVPLHQNKRWISAVANDMVKQLQVSAGGSVLSNNLSSVTNNESFTQNIYSPTPLSRYEIYRQTRNLLALAKGVNA